MKGKGKTGIVSISFYYKGERRIIECRRDGTFRLPVSRYRNGSLKTDYKNLTARQVIEHEIVKDCDPVFTLATGEKVRAYTGGDPSYLPAISDGIITKHDDHYLEKKMNKLKGRVRSEKTIIPPAPALYPNTEDMDQMGFPWDDDDY